MLTFKCICVILKEKGECFCMRTSLKYSVDKRERYDPIKDKLVHIIKSRGFEFLVSGAKTAEEHSQVVESFYNFLTQYGYNADFFGSGSWEDNVRVNSTKEYQFLYIPVDTVEDKEQIENIYKDWKVRK